MNKMKFIEMGNGHYKLPNTIEMTGIGPKTLKKALIEVYTDYMNLKEEHEKLVEKVKICHVCYDYLEK
jgi:hypothetical protein